MPHSEFEINRLVGILKRTMNTTLRALAVASVAAAVPLIGLACTSTAFVDSTIAQCSDLFALHSTLLLMGLLDLGTRPWRWIVSSREVQAHQPQQVLATDAVLAEADKLVASSGCPHIASAMGFYGGTPNQSPLRLRCAWAQRAASGGGGEIYRVHRRGAPHSIVLDGGSAAVRRWLLANDVGSLGKLAGQSRHTDPITALLQDSLTQAEGTEAWGRQRRAVKQAIGSGVAVARSFAAPIGVAATGLGAELQRSAQGQGVASISAAAAALCAVVLGRKPAARATKALLQMYRSGRRAYGQHARPEELARVRSAAAALRAAVEAAYDALDTPAAAAVAAEGENAESPTPLLRRMANATAPALMTAGDTAPPLLSRAEAVANAHSSLLAGPPPPPPPPP
eukprot:SAG11_NODE_4792_length_1764_cov_38.358559_1_plen_396_part_01